MLRNMSLPLVRSRDEFEFWLFDMDDAIAYFISALPSDVRLGMDYSQASLGVLETWLLGRYPNIDAATERYELRRIEDASRYVGEVYRRALGGKWDVELKNLSRVYRELPILRGPNLSFEICPFTFVTASLDRRTGNYMGSVLGNMIKNYGAS